MEQLFDRVAIVFKWMDPNDHRGCGDRVGIPDRGAQHNRWSGLNADPASFLLVAADNGFLLSTRQACIEQRAVDAHLLRVLGQMLTRSSAV